MNYDSSAFDELGEIFASNDNGHNLSDLDFGETGSCQSGAMGYAHIAIDVIDPMREDFKRMREITQAMFQAIPGIG